MIPKELYNRRRQHNNTPQSILLIVTNYIVAAILFMVASPTGWFFSVVLAGLIFYNIHTIRRNREEYNRINVIAYIVSWVGIILMFVVMRNI